MSTEEGTAYQIDRDELTAAIIKLNSMCRSEGVVMKKDGHVDVGNSTDAETLCILIPAPKLARQLTADGLSSYSGKELKKWADAYEIEPLQQIVDAAVH